MNRLLEIKNLTKHYTSKKGIWQPKTDTVKAVNAISFHINEQETLGIVGESGCGKSTTGRAILRLHKPTSGQVLYRGTDILSLTEKEFLPYRQKMQIIFQNANSAFDPRWTISRSLTEAIELHMPSLTPDEVRDRIASLMQEVGFDPSHQHKYPHEFSGGQRQRLGIAKAISVSPEFIVCDEPVSALDVSVQAQVLNLMKKLQQDRKLSYLFISHDLSVIRFISHRVAVMYAGKIVEMANTKAFFDSPCHPYSRVLMEAIPRLTLGDDHVKTRFNTLDEIAGAPKSGCPFRSRCRYASSDCIEVEPELKEVSKNHFVACHHFI